MTIPPNTSLYFTLFFKFFYVQLCMAFTFHTRACSLQPAAGSVAPWWRLSRGEEREGAGPVVMVKHFPRGQEQEQEQGTAAHSVSQPQNPHRSRHHRQVTLLSPPSLRVGIGPRCSGRLARHMGQSDGTFHLSVIFLPCGCGAS